METITQQLQNAYNDTKIKDDDYFYRLATFTKIKFDFLIEARKLAEKINHSILKKRVANAWQLGDWQLVAETVKDINNN